MNEKQSYERRRQVYTRFPRELCVSINPDVSFALFDLLVLAMNPPIPLCSPPFAAPLFNKQSLSRPPLSTPRYYP
jgi:hypothetical protein